MPLKLRDGKLIEVDKRTPDDSVVRLAPEDDVLKLRDTVQGLECVELSYPAYTDGRAHSQARMLREHLGFDGEIRATGDIRPDQVQMMVRCGVDVFEFDNPEAERTLSTSPERYLGRYPETYQSGYNDVP